MLRALPMLRALGREGGFSEWILPSLGSLLGGPVASFFECHPLGRTAPTRPALRPDAVATRMPPRVRHGGRWLHAAARGRTLPPLEFRGHAVRAARLK
jgi:hypothetical protein